MTIIDALTQANEQLSALPSPELEARLLLAHVLRKPQTWLFANETRPVGPARTSKYFTLVSRRKRRVPLAYLTHQKEFYGLDFYVDKHVLIPRPETEQLVNKSLDVLANFDSRRQVSNRALKRATTELKNFVVADIGTGSGCIAISIAHSYLQPKIRLAYGESRQAYHLPPKTYATDLSPAALQIARRNAQNVLGTSHNITFLQGNLLEPLPEKADLIIANLPYLSEREYAETRPEVKQEPKEALLGGGPNGQSLIKQLLKRAPEYLKPSGKVIYESTGGVVLEWDN